MDTNPSGGRATVREVYKLVDSRTDAINKKIDDFTSAVTLANNNFQIRITTMETAGELEAIRLKDCETTVKNVELRSATFSGTLQTLKALAGISLVLAAGSVGSVILNHVWK